MTDWSRLLNYACPAYVGCSGRGGCPCDVDGLCSWPIPQQRGRLPVAVTANLFMNSRSQAVRLPARFRFEGTEVLIERDGGAVILRRKPQGWDGFFLADPRTTDDFLADRDQEPPQERDWLDGMDA
jgi:antitoxin VapB